MALRIDYYENQRGEGFREFLFNNEDKLKKELGNSKIILDKEANTITLDGIQFSVDENGNITKIEGIALSEKKKKLNIVQGVEEQPKAELVATLVTIQGEITWKSSNEEVVKITGSGNKVTITGLKDGIAIITASCQGEEASCEVTVRTVEIATELSLNPINVIIGKQETAEITVEQNGTEEIEWESSDNRIVTVEGTGENGKIGKLTGIEAGEVIITARTQNKTATCNVLVEIVADSLLEGIGEITTGGIKRISVNGTTDSEISDSTQYKKETYYLNVVMIDGALELNKELGTNGKVKINGVEKAISEIQNFSVSSDGKTYSVGNTKDIATANDYASNTVVLKVRGNLDMQEEVTLTSITGTYGGPKGLIVYCEETLTNNGMISMTARGAKAVGQNVFLWKNKNGSFEFVPAQGGAGGASVSSTSWSDKKGNPGGKAPIRGTGGGGSGSCMSQGMSENVGGAGSIGTSFSGGTGGGCALYNRGSAGGNRSSKWWCSVDRLEAVLLQSSIIRLPFGIGNPSGGTGGLLVICSKNIKGAGKIMNEGTSATSLSTEIGNSTTYWGFYSAGSSGGGSTNIFYSSEAILDGMTLSVKGGVSAGTKPGGNGGEGSITSLKIDENEN